MHGRFNQELTRSVTDFEARARITGLDDAQGESGMRQSSLNSGSATPAVSPKWYHRLICPEVACALKIASVVPCSFVGVASGLS